MKIIPFLPMTIFLILLSVPFIGAEQGDTGKWEIEAGYVLPLSSFDIYGETSLSDLSYGSNNPVAFKLGIRYEQLGFSYNFGQSPSENEYDLETVFYDLQGSLYLGRWGGDLNIQNYRGVLCEDSTGEFFPYPELQTRAFTLNIYRRLGGNTDLSSFYYTREEEPPFSYFFFGLGSLSFRSLKTETSLIPDPYLPYYGTLPGLRHMTLISPTLSAGAYGSLNWRIVELYASLSAGFGPALLEANIDLEPYYTIKVNFKTGSVFHGDRFSLGLAAVDDSDALQLSDDRTIQFHTIKVDLFLSYRF